MSDETKKRKMNKEFVPYEQALELKGLGFNEPCFGYYNNMGGYIDEYGKLNSSCNKPGMHGKYCTAPLYQQVFRWFREKHGWDGVISRDTLFYKKTYLILLYKDFELWNKDEKFKCNNYKTYEEAELVCLIKLIEIVKTK